MELSNEILGSLQTFLVLVVVVIALLTAAMLVIGVRVLSIEKRGKDKNKDIKSKRFEDHANELLEQGRLDELVQHASSRVSTHPYHVDARWYLAVGYYHLGDMANAIREFEHVSAINPAWEETGVAPFMERITSVYETAQAIGHH